MWIVMSPILNDIRILNLWVGCNYDPVVDMLDLLKSEIHPSRSDMQASPKYRQDVAVNLFYKVGAD